LFEYYRDVVNFYREPHMLKKFENKNIRNRKIQVDASFTRQKHQFPKDAPIYALCHKYSVNYKKAKEIMEKGVLATMGRDFIMTWRRLHGKSGHKVLGVVRNAIKGGDTLCQK